MNLQKIMQMQQQMKQKMAKIEEEKKNSEFLGESGGGLVKILMSGEGLVKKVNIDDSALEDKDMLEDLLVAAFNNAAAKISDADNKAMKDNFGGLNIPGFKKPF